MNRFQASALLKCARPPCSTVFFHLRDSSVPPKFTQDVKRPILTSFQIRLSKMSLNTRVRPLFLSFCLSSSFPDHYVFHPSSFPQTSSSFGHVSFLLPFSFFLHSLRPTNPPQILSPAVFGCWACLPFPSGCWVGHTVIALAPSTFQGWLLQAEHTEKLPRLPPLPSLPQPQPHALPEVTCNSLGVERGVVGSAAGRTRKGPGRDPDPIMPFPLLFLLLSEALFLRG